jgi:hypothetical protein
MVVAFIVLSLAMIVGGLAAVVLGWDIVLVERGWTMVIAGSVIAGSGAVLLGIAGVIGRLGRIRSELATLQEDLSRVAAPAPPPPIMVDPIAAGSSSLRIGEAAGTTPADADDRAEDARPDLPPFLRPVGEPASAAEVSEEAGSRRQPAGEPDPDRLLEDDHREPIGDADGRRDGSASRGGVAELRPKDKPPLPPFEPEDQADRVASSATEAEVPPEVEPPADSESAQEPEPETQTEADADQRPTVIGTYNSGDNRYVMFSDGSIEAETPDGIFRFTSLDELKEFIASGGEGGSSAS